MSKGSICCEREPRERRLVSGSTDTMSESTDLQSFVEPPNGYRHCQRVAARLVR